MYKDCRGHFRRSSTEVTKKAAIAEIAVDVVVVPAKQQKKRLVLLSGAKTGQGPGDPVRPNQASFDGQPASNKDFVCTPTGLNDWRRG